MTNRTPLSQGIPRENLVVGASVLLLAVLFTAWSVKKSFLIGRLASVPAYDDVVYFLSGTKLLEAFHAGGLASITAEIRQHGLHSPFSSLLALVAFGTFGYQDWAPYAFNGIIAAGYLSILAYLYRGLPLPARIAILIPYLALPFATLAVVEFRPDLCWAVVIGFCAVYGITSRDYFDGWRTPVQHGLLFGAALLIKPSTFAMTVIVFGYSVVARSLIEWIKQGEEFQIKPIMRDSTIAVGAGLIVALPYWIPFWESTWNYFWTNAFGAHQEVWRTPGDFWYQIGFYLWGGGAANNLGYPGLLLAVLAIAASFLPAIRRDRIQLARTLALWGIVAITYVINTLAAVKSPFLGGAFYGTLIFSSAFLLNRAAETWLAAEPGRSRRFNLAVAMLAVAAVALHRWPDYSGRWNESGAYYARVETEVEKILERIHFPNKVRLLVSHSGPIMGPNVLIWLIRHGIPAELLNGFWFTTTGQFQDALQYADLVIVQQRNTLGAALKLPAEPLQDKFLEIARTAPRVSLLGEITADNGRKILILRRIGQDATARD